MSAVRRKDQGKITEKFIQFDAATCIVFLKGSPMFFKVKVNVGGQEEGPCARSTSPRLHALRLSALVRGARRTKGQERWHGPKPRSCAGSGGITGTASLAREACRKQPREENSCGDNLKRLIVPVPCVCVCVCECLCLCVCVCVYPAEPRPCPAAVTLSDAHTHSFAHAVKGNRLTL